MKEYVLLNELSLKLKIYIKESFQGKRKIDYETLEKNFLILKQKSILERFILFYNKYSIEDFNELLEDESEVEIMENVLERILKYLDSNNVKYSIKSKGKIDKYFNKLEGNKLKLRLPNFNLKENEYIEIKSKKGIQLVMDEFHRIVLEEYTAFSENLFNEIDLFENYYNEDFEFIIQ